jgi:hypothetical protein
MDYFIEWLTTFLKIIKKKKQVLKSNNYERITQWQWLIL